MLLRPAANGLDRRASALVWACRPTVAVSDISWPDLYLNLLKGALTHTLYNRSDAVVYPTRIPLARLLAAALMRFGIQPLRVSATLGDQVEGRYLPLFAHTMVGVRRLDNIQACVEDVIVHDVPGDLIETGVWRGGSTIFMRAILMAREVSNRAVWVADSFQGLPPPDPSTYPTDAGSKWHKYKPIQVSLEEVKANFRRYDMLDDQVKFVKGWFKDTLPSLRGQAWAVIRLDGDMYSSTMEALENLYPGLSPGGYLIVDDYSIPECRQAVHDYRNANGIDEPIHEIDWTGAYWQREAGT